ncbi:MAG: hypothetical protein HQK57_03055 [Deltaproteobacteria bacterium]|nr:hypothetical protein [Deltaproteobacteria bacterium]MBF0524458.1 hypothetical protein [Deltaproteobacteria bacterium]
MNKIILLLLAAAAITLVACDHAQLNPGTKMDQMYIQSGMPASANPYEPHPAMSDYGWRE